MRLLLGSLGALAITTTGCFIDMGSGTGDSAPASFSYESLGSGSSCPLDRPALAGSRVTVNAYTGLDMDVSSVRVAPSGFVHLDSTARSCDSLSCTFTIDIHTSQPGDGAIELLPTRSRRTRSWCSCRTSSTRTTRSSTRTDPT